jgi:dihydroorotate dehydrogenase electron transfer subunit
MTRVTAPFGRRAAAVAAREEHGAYVVLRCLDRAGPWPRAGQFYMLATAGGWGGGDEERPFLPRAFSVLRARGLGGADGAIRSPPPAATAPRGDPPSAATAPRGDPPSAATAPRGDPPSDATVPVGAELHFLIEDVGPGTRRLCEVQPGEDLLLVGPLGNGFDPPRDGRAPLLIGGGVGIAPLAIWQDRLPAGAKALLGFRDRRHAHAAALLSNATVATDDGSVGHRGLVTELLDEELDARGDEVEVYACGPPAMLDAVRHVCARRPVPAQLALESGMACGFGACFGCVVPTVDGYVRLCLHGPVLDAAKLAGASSVGSPVGEELPGGHAGAELPGGHAGAELPGGHQ